ncbi:MAG: YbbR-like protein [Acidobacteriales bacterium]|nr:YbbR-like protein [Terriglobales bacterium]
MALAIAVLLWVAIASAPQAEVGFIVPIEFLNVPNGMEINLDTPPQAQVRLRGPDRLVRRIANADLHMAVDAGTLAAAQPGERTFELSVGQINVPAGVEVVQIIPSSVRLSFDKRVYRNLEVRPRVLGSFSPGYRIASVSAEPSEVAVVGPEKRVNAVEAATTDPIDASGVLGKHVFVSNPYVQDPLVRLSRPVAVHVTVVTEKTK